MAITPRSIYGGEGGGGDFGGGMPMPPTAPGVSTAPPGTQGPPGTSNFVVPAFYRTPMFPYANLADQLQDALGLSSRGAGVYANQQYGKAQHIKNMPANLGGGLLGMTAYGRGIGMPGGGMPPGGGPGLPPPPGGYAPGAPMPRPNPNPGRTAPPPGPGSTRPTGPAPLPWSRGNPPPPGGGLLGPPTGAPTARSTPAAPTGPGMAPPTGATSDPKALAALFMSTDPANRGNLFNAISQYGLKTGNGNLGGLLQTELKNQLGADAQRNWLTTMDTKQGSTVGREGLPPWLISALGG
jgi:hypothetical protein